MTAYGSDNGWNEDVTIGPNGEYSATSFFVTKESGKEFGRVQILNGVLIMTATNQTPDSRLPVVAKRLYRAFRQQIIYADENKILVSGDPLDEKILLEKKAESHF